MCTTIEELATEALRIAKLESLSDKGKAEVIADYARSLYHMLYQNDLATLNATRRRIEAEFELTQQAEERASMAEFRLHAAQKEKAALRIELANAYFALKEKTDPKKIDEEPIKRKCNCWFSLNTGPNGECEVCGGIPNLKPDKQVEGTGSQ